VGQIAREVEGSGGEINAWTSHDETVYHLVLASRFFDAGLDILADTIQNAGFDPVEFDRERHVVLEEIKQGLDDPERQAGQGLFEAAFDQHPYGRPIIGTEATVRRLRREDLVAFFSKYYVASNLTLVVVGDFDAESARQRITQAFSSIPAGVPVAARPRQVEQSQLRVVAAARDVKETQLLLGFHTPAINHPDVPALDLLAVALGQGDSSRLNLEVVRNRQLVTNTSAYLFSARDPGLVVVAASLPPGRVDEAARALLDEILRFSREEMAQEEWPRRAPFWRATASTTRRPFKVMPANWASSPPSAGDVNFEDRYLASLEKLTPADLRASGCAVPTGVELDRFAQLPEPKTDKQRAKTEKTTASIRKLSRRPRLEPTRGFARATAAGEGTVS